MPIILDASVAIKLVVAEPGSAQARAVILDEDERVAPDWMMTEVASALANKVRHEGLSIPRAEAALDAIPHFVDQTVNTQKLLPQTVKLSAEIGHALYDCLYLVVATQVGGRVITADKNFHAKASRSGYGGSVELLTW